MRRAGLEFTTFVDFFLSLGLLKNSQIAFIGQLLLPTSASYTLTLYYLYSIDREATACLLLVPSSGIQP